MCPHACKGDGTLGTDSVITQILNTDAQLSLLPYKLTHQGIVQALDWVRGGAAAGRVEPEAALGVRARVAHGRQRAPRGHAPAAHLPTDPAAAHRAGAPGVSNARQIALCCMAVEDASRRSPLTTCSRFWGGICTMCSHFFVWTCLHTTTHICALDHSVNPMAMPAHSFETCRGGPVSCGRLTPTALHVGGVALRHQHILRVLDRAASQVTYRLPAWSAGGARAPSCQAARTRPPGRTKLALQGTFARVTLCQLHKDNKLV